MILTKRQVERLIVIFLLGFVCLNFPLLAAFSAPVLWLGIPALFLYLYIFWAVFIGLIAAVMENRHSAGADVLPPERGNKD